MNKEFFTNLYRRFFKNPEDMNLLELCRYGNRINKKKHVKANLDRPMQLVIAKMVAPYFQTSSTHEEIKEELVTGFRGFFGEKLSETKWGVNDAFTILGYFGFGVGWHELNERFELEIDGIWDVVDGAILQFVMQETNLDNIITAIHDITDKNN